MNGEWLGGSFQPVAVTQPPRRAAPMRLNAKGLKGAERKEALALLAQHRSNKKAAKGRIKDLNKQIKKHKAGARMNKRRKRFHREEKAQFRRIAKHRGQINGGLERLKRAKFKAQLNGIKAQIALNKQSISASKKAIRGHQRKIKQMQNAHSARGQKRAAMRAFHQAKKAASWMWLLRQATKAVRKATRARKSDGRNHGMTGVRRKGVTGLAGR